MGGLVWVFFGFEWKSAAMDREAWRRRDREWVRLELIRLQIRAPPVLKLPNRMGGGLVKTRDKDLSYIRGLADEVDRQPPCQERRQKLLSR